MKPYPRTVILLMMALSFFLSCSQDKGTPSIATLAGLNLKRGPVITCGPPAQQFGKVNFPISDEKAQSDFNLAVALLHSFEYDESEKVFTRIIDARPGCAMAYWGIAMCNFHPLWTPPTEEELKKGSQAAGIAKGISRKSKEEAAFIDAINLFYADYQHTGHFTRCVRYEQAMEKIHADQPDNLEVTIFYTLALDASAKPTDLSFANQKKAGEILTTLYRTNPNHPGIIHYIIHTYDYPGLADSALPAAREYAKVAPSSAHALHMPSHIFTRLGLWDECIASNQVSLTSAKCYAEQAHMNGHWAEELHAMDYLTYAYLQKGDNEHAREQLRTLDTVKTVYPLDFKVAYAFASVPARVALENKNWKQAAGIALNTAIDSWGRFPWQKSIYHFTRALGFAHRRDKPKTQMELDSLKKCWLLLQQQGDRYKAKEVEIQLLAGKAWYDFEFSSRERALNEMNLAAAMEDSTQKHPVTPGEVLPARELLGDMLSETGHYDAAFVIYEAVLQRSPGRFNSLYGAGHAAEKTGDKQNARQYYQQLLQNAGSTGSTRPELKTARAFLARR